MKETGNKTKSNNGYMRLVIGYAIFCLLVLIIVAIMLNRFMIKSNTSQINNILSLMSEKVNTSFEMMTDYISEAADIISAQKEISFEENYDELQKTLVNMPYFSIGMLGKDGTVYGASGEQMDIMKHNFAEKAENAETLYISEPYRSSVTGSNMITIFAPLYQEDTYAGSVYVTYYLETIQNLAYTNILSEETAVFLMNPYSGNFVNCSDDGGNPPGTWSNVRLIKNNIRCMNGYDYDTWLEAMKNNDTENIINFRQGESAYTQAYVHINGMDNWNLVIRIPISELSSTMQQYALIVAVCAALMILATMFLAVQLYKKEHSRTEILQTLSDADALTRIMNRRGFNNTMSRIFEDKSKIGRSTFIFIDIDFFKDVNDQYGHAAGDYVLCAAATILKEVFQDIGIVARMGGDEFNVFVHEPLTVEDIDALMAAVRMKFSEIILQDGTPLPLSFSAGLSVYPKDAVELEQLKECADKALYYVKENGRKNHFWFCDLK